MKRTALLLIFALAANAAETRQERGKRVVYEALKALGGEAFLHMQDRVESGRAYSFYNKELSGLSIARLYTRYLAPVPGKVSVRERESFGKKEDVYTLLREDGAWEVTFRGARPFADERYANYQDSTLHNIFYILRQRLNEPGISFYAQDSDFVEHRPVEIIDITDAGNRTVTVYFDQSSKFPIKQVLKRRNTEYKDFDTETTTYAKFRDVGGGVFWPCTVMRERNGDKIFEMYSDSVEVNKSLTDDLFSLPGALKVLPIPK
jgi:hypothetical protein